MGCADPRRREVGALHQCPLGSVASYLIYADVRSHIPMTHHIPQAGHLNDGTTLPNDVCLNVAPTAGGGKALKLWAKKQPDGAMAVFLINNHQSNTYV